MDERNLYLEKKMVFTFTLIVLSNKGYPHPTYTDRSVIPKIIS